jgi:hypothetical protein
MRFSQTKEIRNSLKTPASSSQLTTGVTMSSPLTMIGRRARSEVAREEGEAHLVPQKVEGTSVQARWCPPRVYLQRR